jgi:hypothetical protein
MRACELQLIGKVLVPKVAMPGNNHNQVKPTAPSARPTYTFSPVRSSLLSFGHGTAQCSTGHMFSSKVQI